MQVLYFILQLIVFFEVIQYVFPHLAYLKRNACHSGYLQMVSFGRRNLKTNWSTSARHSYSKKFQKNFGLNKPKNQFGK